MVMVAIGGVAIADRPAEACTCTPAVLVSPAPGTEGVPTNVELFRTGNGPSVVSLVGGGESVEVSMEQLTCGGYRYRAVLDLQPNTSYEVRQYDPPEVLTTFTTGDGPDEAAPSAAVIDELWFGVNEAEEQTDCDGRTQIRLSVGAPDATTLLVRLETNVGACEMIIFPEETGNFGNPFGESCRVFTPLTAGEESCWEVRARDAAGNEGPSARQCATVLSCAASDGEDLTDCTVPSSSSAGGCSVDPRDSLAGALMVVGAGVGTLAVRRRRRSKR